MVFCKSLIKSSTLSMPILILTRSSGNSLALFTSEGMEAWDMIPGREIREVTDPKLTVILNSFVFVTMCFESATLPVVKHTTDPPPDIRHTCIYNTYKIYFYKKYSTYHVCIYKIRINIYCFL